VRAEREEPRLEALGRPGRLQQQMPGGDQPALQQVDHLVVVDRAVHEDGLVQHHRGERAEHREGEDEAARTRGDQARRERTHHRQGRHPSSVKMWRRFGGAPSRRGHGTGPLGSTRVT